MRRGGRLYFLHSPQRIQFRLDVLLLEAFPVVVHVNQIARTPLLFSCGCSMKGLRHSAGSKVGGPW